jgi:uncharacterized membrane protein
MQFENWTAVRPDALLTVLLMALVTYATRAAGLWLMRYVRPSPLIDAWIRHLPGAVLISIVAPAALTGGAASIAATVLAVLVAARTHNLLLTIIVGVIAVTVLRHAL